MMSLSILGKELEGKTFYVFEERCETVLFTIMFHHVDHHYGA